MALNKHSGQRIVAKGGDATLAVAAHAVIVMAGWRISLMIVCMKSAVFIFLSDTEFAVCIMNHLY